MTSTDDDDIDYEAVATDIESLLRLAKVSTLAELGERLDSNLELDGWLEDASDEAPETGAVLVRVEWRGIFLPFPFALGELWDLADELDDEVVAGLDDETAE